MRYLRQSTATAVAIGPFVDSADGATPETALTVTSMSVNLQKHSNTHPLANTAITPTASAGNNDCSHIAVGMYSLELTATDTGTLGRMTMLVTITGALPVYHEFHVLEEQVFDSLFDTGDLLQVDSTQQGGTTLTARDIGASVLLSPGTGTGQISLSSGAVTAGTVSDKTGYSLAADQAVNVTKWNGTSVHTEVTAGVPVVDVHDQATALVDAVHDEVVEGSTTLRQAIRLILAVLTGKSSGGGTSTLVFRDIGDSKNRISCTVDADGNRTAVGTRDGS